MEEKQKQEVERHQAAGKLLQELRTGLVLTGRIKDGKLELDEATKQEIAKKYPKGDVAFIAMNSPFDPNSQSV